MHVCVCWVCGRREGAEGIQLQPGRPCWSCPDTFAQHVWALSAAGGGPRAEVRRLPPWSRAWVLKAATPLPWRSMCRVCLGMAHGSVACPVRAGEHAAVTRLGALRVRVHPGCFTESYLRDMHRQP